MSGSDVDAFLFRLISKSFDEFWRFLSCSSISCILLFCSAAVDLLILPAASAGIFMCFDDLPSSTASTFFAYRIATCLLPIFLLFNLVRTSIESSA